MVTPAPSSTSTTGFGRDPFLPQRDRLLDAEAMGAVLATALGRPVHSCTRVRAKYRVGESLRVSYALASDGETLRLSLRAFPIGTAPTAGLSPPDVHLDCLNALGWMFPNDRKLTTLGRFWSSDGPRPLLGPGVDRLDLVSYAPEKAATMRCRTADATVGYAKLYAAALVDRAAAIHRRLAPALIARGVAAPAVVGTDDDLGVMLVAPVAGHSLASRTSLAEWRTVGQAIAQLHAIPLSATLPRFERATIGRLHSVGAMIVSVRPDVGVEVRGLLDRLEALAPAAASEQPDVTLHGDLHPKNVVIDGDRPGLIDLDQAARGPAAAELGSAIAALRYGSDARAGEVLEQALLDGYSSERALPSEAALAWHVAAALLGERALRAVNRVRPDGLARLPAVVDSALAALAEVR